MYEQVIEILKPKLAFLTAWYSPAEMAFVYACRRHGVHVVDIQHGAIDKHPMYLWKYGDAIGKTLLPDNYWTWGRFHAAICNEYLNSDRTTQRTTAIAGGNRWAAFYMNHRDNIETQMTIDDSLPQNNGNAKRILITTSHFSHFDVAFPTPLIELMCETQDEFLWIIRPHPYFKGSLDDFTSNLHDAGITNYSIHTAQSIPLYQVLESITHHVTSTSVSVAYDALMFSVSSAFTHVSGCSHASDLIEKGVWFSALTKSALQKFVETSETDLHADKDLIGIDNEATNMAYKALMNRAGL
jgi:hypothetical protein